jgi:hypothetical protein
MAWREDGVDDVTSRKSDRTLARVTAVAAQIGTVGVAIDAQMESGEAAWAVRVDTSEPDRAVIVAAASYHRHILAFVFESELAFEGLDGALALVKGFDDAVFEPGRKVEVPSYAYQVPPDRRAAAYLIADPASFGREFPEGVLLAVALLDYEIDTDGEALLEEVITRVPDGLSWI